MPILDPIADAIQPIATCTNVRAGSYISRNPATPDLIINQDEPDRWQEGDLWRLNVEDGATAVTPSDLALWNKNQDANTPQPIVTPLPDGITFQVTFEVTALSTWGSVINYVFGGTPIANVNGYNGFMYRVISGNVTDLQMKYTGGAGGADNFTAFNADGEWHQADGFPITGRTRCELQLPGTADGGSGIVTTVVMEIKHMMTADNITPCAPVPVGPAGVSYGPDRPSIPDPVVSSVGEVAVGVLPKGWGAGAPSGQVRPNSGARIVNWSAGSIFNLRLSGSVQDQWFADGNVNTQYSGIMTDGEWTSHFGAWDGVNIRAEAKPGTVNTGADTTVPTGTMHLGNNSGGTRPAGAVISVLLYPTDQLTDGQRDAVANEIANPIVTIPDGGIGVIDPGTLGLGLGVGLGLGSAYSYPKSSTGTGQISSPDAFDTGFDGGFGS
jgi:hypothetical protein